MWSSSSSSRWLKSPRPASSPRRTPPCRFPAWSRQATIRHLGRPQRPGPPTRRPSRPTRGTPAHHAPRTALPGQPQKHHQTTDPEGKLQRLPPGRQRPESPDELHQPRGSPPATRRVGMPSRQPTRTHPRPKRAMPASCESRTSAGARTPSEHRAGEGSGAPRASAGGKQRPRPLPSPRAAHQPTRQLSRPTHGTPAHRGWRTATPGQPRRRRPTTGPATRAGTTRTRAAGR
mmetsp:Transcript_19023/g.55928  ORF Transcript_19023/g.55928 Transcript_19023/m.55928 type:complete len:232 (+) Transcript_19023:64-759(+)